MILYPNAKINLGLNIVSKRPDGYHNLETVFYPIYGLQDKLTIQISDEQVDNQDDSPGYHFSSSGLKIDGPDEKNLIIKALLLLKANFEIPCLDIHLEKIIPFGAGLGGGSADAAFALKGINELCSLGLSDLQLEAFASRIGADCPVFIKNKPVYAEGIGNDFSTISLDLKNFYLVLVKPDIHVSTAEAYSLVKPQNPTTALSETIKTPILEWKELMVNDFEISVFQNHVRIGEIKQKMYDFGAIYASMSGSGSSVFGIFEQPTSLPSEFVRDVVFEGKL